VLRSQKKDFVAELEGVCRDSDAVVFTHYHGLTVAQVTELRRGLRAQGAGFKVVKNTLFKIAADNAKIQLADGMASGPIAIAYSSDPVAAAKGVMEFAKKNDSLKIIGAVVNNQLLSPKEIDKLSKLPSLDELRGKIVGLLGAPATKIAAILQAPAGGLARVVGAYGAKQ
jgi:large subunit ribosomal protein L10